MSRLMTASSSEELFRAAHMATRFAEDATGGAPWRRQPMTLLVLGDLGVDIMGFRADDDRDHVEVRLLRSSKPFRAEDDAVAAVIGSPAHNDGLKNAAQSNVLSELGDLLIGEFGPRVGRVFLEAVDRHEEREAFGSESVEREHRRVSVHLKVDALIGSSRDGAFDPLRIRLVDEIELLHLRLGPGHAHGRIVPLGFAPW
jgi:hypothetical protein